MGAPLHSFTAEPRGLRVPDRLQFLDGMRGWGALAVVLYHCFVDGFPAGPWAAMHLWRLPPFNATLAVTLFFMISGYALSVAFVRTRDRVALARLAIGRYVRLVVPIAAACAVVFVLLKAGLIAAWQERPAPFDGMLRFDPSALDLVAFAFWRVFFDYSVATTFIGPLWTMQVELFGSFLVFGLLAVLGRFRHRVIVFALLFVVLLAARSFYCLFVAGLIAAELHRRPAPRVPWQLALGLSILAFLLSALGSRAPQIPYPQLAAPVLLFAALGMWPSAQAWLGNRLGRFLGWISFPLYLIHGPVMFAVSLPLLVALQDGGVGEVAARLVTSVLTVPAAILASLALVPANALAVRWSRRLGDVLLRKDQNHI